MGLPLFSIIANMVMENVEERANYSFHSPLVFGFAMVMTYMVLLNQTTSEKFD